MKKALEAYCEKIYPFHMPGHKLGRLAPLEASNFYNLDVTEVEGTDNLYQPNGIIGEAQERARQLYGALHTFFLVNGSSGGLLSAIGACCIPDGKILINRNSHKSIYHAILINRLEPIYIYPEYIEEYGLLGGISPNQVEEALRANPDIACVVITSPTYEGFTSDIKSIAAIVHSHGKLLIVDEAHGAHFKFHAYFPKSALVCDADVVVHSLHKTLPAFTQSALLHINSDRVNVDQVRDYLMMYQTSSPSYILMTGIDACIGFLATEGEKYFEQFVGRIELFRNETKKLKNMKVIDQGILGKCGIFDIDLSKIVIVGNIVGKEQWLNGKHLDSLLRAVYHQQVEMSMPGSLVAITTIADEAVAFEAFSKALSGIDDKNNYINMEKFDIIGRPEKIMAPFYAFQRQQESVHYLEALGRVSGQFLTVYPPGIPIIVPGEKITAAILGALKKYQQNGLTIIGLNDQKIKVVK